MTLGGGNCFYRAKLLELSALHSCGLLTQERHKSAAVDH